MIFKTFDSDIDKISAKWGIFGKSFYDFAEASRNRKIAIDDLFTLGGVPLKDAKKQVGSFWSYLYPKKEDIQAQMIDVAPKIDVSNVSEVTEKVKLLSGNVKNGITTWQELFDNVLPAGQKHLAQIGQELEGQIVTNEKVITTNEKLRSSALAHNAALKQQTLGAKASELALKGLAIAGNALVAWGLTIAFKAAIKWADSLTETIEEQKEALEDYKNEIQERVKNLKLLKIG